MTCEVARSGSIGGLKKKLRGISEPEWWGSSGFKKALDLCLERHQHGGFIWSIGSIGHTLEPLIFSRAALQKPCSRINSEKTTLTARWYRVIQCDLRGAISVLRLYHQINPMCFWLWSHALSPWWRCYWHGHFGSRSGVYPNHGSSLKVPCLWPDLINDALWPRQLRLY